MLDADVLEGSTILLENFSPFLTIASVTDSISFNTTKYSGPEMLNVFTDHETHDDGLIFSL